MSYTTLAYGRYLIRNLLYYDNIVLIYNAIRVYEM